MQLETCVDSSSSTETARPPSIPRETETCGISHTIPYSTTNTSMPRLGSGTVFELYWNGRRNRLLCLPISYMQCIRSDEATSVLETLALHTISSTPCCLFITANRESWFSRREFVRPCVELSFTNYPFAVLFVYLYPFFAVLYRCTPNQLQEFLNPPREPFSLSSS
ncbi:uncharacterized protein RAG0_14728 [Rhynchosporium agropyri]|uniref:Uncharacterized protein n=1 Tax=Rhynchosporium agropyri TaxID=914238 RepID=A0A1E1LI45_9HELO|nr:uncharacterized protein RAG0_14728 [Rhynchosporium agropyri]